MCLVVVYLQLRPTVIVTCNALPSKDLFSWQTFIGFDLVVEGSVKIIPNTG